MRQIHLNLAAIALIALCAFLIPRQSVRNGATSGNVRLPTPSTRSTPPATSVSTRSEPATSIQPMPDGQTAAAGRPAATTLPGKPQGQQTGAGEPATNGQASSVADSAAQPPASSPAPSSDNPALGIQLADNVQLPAVIIALSDPNKDPEHKTPPPVAAAMQRIVDSFYQELANSARENSNAPITDADGQQTLLIQPGPAVERARANANESYRVLFGDEAYNRLTMNSLLEARLSKDPGPK